MGFGIATFQFTHFTQILVRQSPSHDSVPHRDTTSQSIGYDKKTTWAVWTMELSRCNHHIRGSDVEPQHIYPKYFIGLISDDDESAYRDDVKHLVRWCASNDLVLNVSKTKEIVVDFRKSKSVPSTLIFNNSEVEIVDSFKFLGIHITSNLSWSLHARYMCKKRSTTSIFSALPQEVSYETRNPSQFLSQ